MVTPFRIQKYLKGLRYPARKSDAVERARLHGADAQVLRALDRLNEQAFYETPVALSRALTADAAA